MGIWDSLGSLFGSAAKGVGNIASSGMQGLGNIGAQLLGGGGNALSSIFKGGGGGLTGGMSNAYQSLAKPGRSLASVFSHNVNPNLSSPFSGIIGQISPFSSVPKWLGGGDTTQQKSGGIWNALKGFGQSKYAGPVAGLAGLFGSQLIPNPKAPPMPAEYRDFYNQMKSGGTPGMQASQNFNMGILSGQNKDVYTAALEGVENEKQAAIKQLEDAYHSARPGSDLTNDAAFNRDMKQLEQQFADRIAMVMAKVQQQASQDLAGLGSQQMQGLATSLSPFADQQNAQLAMDYDKRSGFRNTLGNLGLGMFEGPMQMSMMKRLFGGG